MVDRYDTPIEVGDEIIYVVKRSTKVAINRATVLVVNDRFVWVEVHNKGAEPRRTRLQAGHNIVVLGQL